MKKSFVGFVERIRLGNIDDQDAKHRTFNFVELVAASDGITTSVRLTVESVARNNIPLSAVKLHAIPWVNSTETET